jgi:hypothetical protein
MSAAVFGSGQMYIDDGFGIRSMKAESDAYLTSFIIEYGPHTQIAYSIMSEGCGFRREGEK